MSGLEEDGFVDASVLMRSGIYALTWRGEVVYIGQSKWLFQRLYTHCTAQKNRHSISLGKKTLRGSVFDGVLVMGCLLSDLDRVERDLIQKHRPKYNTLHVKIPIEEVAGVLAQLVAAPLSPNHPIYFNRFVNR